MSKSLFGAKLGEHRSEVSTTRQLVDAITQQNAGRGAPASVDTQTAGYAVAMEGYSGQQADVDSALTSLRTLITQAVATANIGKKISIAQEEAAIVAGFGSRIAKEFSSRQLPGEAQLRQAYQGAKNGTLTTVVGFKGQDADRVAMEAFDERENRNAMAYSVAYNLQAARQGEFGEAFYPTVVITPDNVGFNVNVRILYAYSEVTRATSGALDSFNRKNIIRAIIDYTILQEKDTQLIPVWRSGVSDSNFVTTAQVAQTSLLVDDRTVVTAPLKVGAKFSILALSQTDAMVAAGLEDQTDAVDSSVYLKNIYVQLSGQIGGTGPTVTEVFSFATARLPTASFNAAPQGNTRLLQLNFNTTAISVSSSTKTVAGATSQWLAGLSTSTVRLSVQAFGSLVQDLGDTTVNVAPVSVAAANDLTGAALSLTSGAGATAVALFASATVIGYDLSANRTNSNRRNRGKLLDIQHVNYLYTVPLLPPITALRPVGDTEANDGNLLSNIITATRIQCANAAVTALFDHQSYLKAYANSADVISTQPALFGAAANLVIPAYMESNIDCATALDSLTTSQRAQDLQTLLLNKIRDISMQLFINSGYGPALEAMYEGAPPKPLVLIGVDPITYRYLTLTGDLRYLGDMFDYKIVMSYDSRMTSATPGASTIFITFGVESALNSGAPNPLHFGNMGWKPELTLMMPMVRNGSNVMELTVQPSYRHVSNLPIMGVLTVQNVSTVISAKVSLNAHSV